MRLITAILLLGASVARSQTTVDFFFDPSWGTNGTAITVSQLNACTRATMGSTSNFWELNRGQYGTPQWGTLSSVQGFTFLTHPMTLSLRSSVTVNGTNYTGSGATKMMAYSREYVSQVAAWCFTDATTGSPVPRSKAKVSVGLYFMLNDGPESSYNNLPVNIFPNYYHSWGGDYAIMGGVIDGSDITIRVHCLSGTPVEIDVVRSKVYWITTLCDIVAETAKVRVYDPDTWTQVGSDSILNYGDGSSGYNVTTVMFGEGWNDNTANTTNYFGQIIMDWTTATWPLLLPSNSTPASVVNTISVGGPATFGRGVTF